MRRQELVFFGRVAAKAANSVVADEKILQTLSTKLIENIQQALDTKGIKSKLDQVFQKQSFVVIRVQLLETDKLALLESAKGKEFAQHFENLLASIDGLGLQDTAGASIDKNIKDKVREGMITKMGELIPTKLREGGLNTDFTVVSSEDQSEFFFNTLQEMSNAKSS